MNGRQDKNCSKAVWLKMFPNVQQVQDPNPDNHLEFVDPALLQPVPPLTRIGHKVARHPVITVIIIFFCHHYQSSSSGGNAEVIPVAVTTFPRPSRRPKGAPGGEKSPRHKLGEPLEGEVGKEGHVGQVVFVP